MNSKGEEEEKEKKEEKEEAGQPSQVLKRRKVDTNLVARKVVKMVAQDADSRPRTKWLRYLI